MRAIGGAIGCSRSPWPCNAHWRERSCPAVADDRDVPLPEDQVATQQAVVASCTSSPAPGRGPSCCMSLSRGQPVPAAVQGDLDQAGAVDAEAALAAPQIGRADKSLGDRDEVLLATASRGHEMRFWQERQPSRVTAKACRPRASIVSLRAQRPASRSGGSLIDGPGNAKVSATPSPCASGRRPILPAQRPAASRRNHRRQVDPRQSLRRCGRKPSRARRAAPPSPTSAFGERLLIGPARLVQ